MPIEINPNRIRLSSGAPQRNPERTFSQSPVVLPRRAQENIIPSPETLRTMITSAVEALRRGVRWDRGTILNVLA